MRIQLATYYMQLTGEGRPNGTCARCHQWGAMTDFKQENDVKSLPSLSKLTLAVIGKIRRGKSGDWERTLGGHCHDSRLSKYWPELKHNERRLREGRWSRDIGK